MPFGIVSAKADANRLRAKQGRDTLNTLNAPFPPMKSEEEGRKTLEFLKNKRAHSAPIIGADRIENDEDR